MKTRKKQTVIYIIIIILLLAMTGITVLVKPRDSLNLKEQNLADMRKTIDEVMTSLITGKKIEGLLLAENGARISMEPSTGLAQSITSKMTYTIKDLEVIEENKGNVLLQITVPNVMDSLREALSEMDSFDEALFSRRMKEALGNGKTATYTVNVELSQMDEQWFFIINEQFNNAITGGALSEYINIQEAIMGSLLEGGIE